MAFSNTDRQPIYKDSGFRITDYVKNYDFVVRPFEDKGTKQAKERDLDRK